MCPLPRRTFLQTVGWLATARGFGDRISVESLVESFVHESFESGLNLIANGFRNQRNVDNIFKAIFIAGIREIRPRHVGGKLHAVMMAQPLRELARRLHRRDRFCLAAWHLHDLKESLARDQQDGDWSLSTFDKEGTGEPGNWDELREAMERWDDSVSDRAVQRALRVIDAEDLAMRLVPYAAGSFVNIGHKMILATQVLRMQRGVGWDYGESVLRATVHGLLFRGDGDAQNEGTELSWKLADKLSNVPLRYHSDSGRTLGLLLHLRNGTAQQAQELVFERLRSGESVRAVWDALILRAAEIVASRKDVDRPARREALLPVHAITVTESLEFAFYDANELRTRRFYVLQAANWLLRMDQALRRIVGLRQDVAILDEWWSARANLVGTTPPQIGMSHLLESGFEISAWVQALVRSGQEHHQHKYLAACLNLLDRFDPELRPLLLCPIFGYIPTPGDPPSSLMQRIREEIR
ncbi:MAG: hypothetical protein KDC35_07355 [Acidobacteria bacterium]|nr:hypothetical protein [Acidobacteriota bacterium]